MISGLRALFVLIAIPFLTNCSSHPEIVPYDSRRVTELNVDEVSEAIANDSVFEDAVRSGKPFDLDAETPQMAETVASLEAPSAQAMHTLPVVEEVKAPPARRPASALTNGYYVFSRDCVMRTEPDAGSSGAGQVALGKKLWLDVHNSQWLKAYKKAGTVYVPSSCVK